MQQTNSYSQDHVFFSLLNYVIYPLHIGYRVFFFLDLKIIFFFCIWDIMERKKNYIIHIFLRVNLLDDDKAKRGYLQNWSFWKEEKLV